ncbi:MAG: Histidine kinaselike ATPase domain, partial [Actinomycetia bacterium]|nr:Histidine kinaselike ATPase domain [Actinomycetes bacterium]
MRMMKESREFPGLAQSVRAARTFVLECVSGIEPSSSDAIALMTSELAANSVLHAASSFVVSVELTDAEIRVSVTDEGEGRPEPRDSGPGDQSGRGL